MTKKNRNTKTVTMTNQFVVALVQATPLLGIAIVGIAVSVIDPVIAIAVATGGYGTYSITIIRWWKNYGK